MKSTLWGNVSPDLLAGGIGHLMNLLVTSIGEYIDPLKLQVISISFLNPSPNIKIGPPDPSVGPLLGKTPFNL
jgi:hypothetical protein